MVVPQHIPRQYNHEADEYNGALWHAPVWHRGEELDFRLGHFAHLPGVAESAQNLFIIQPERLRIRAHKSGTVRWARQRGEIARLDRDQKFQSNAQALRNLWQSPAQPLTHFPQARAHSFGGGV